MRLDESFNTYCVIMARITSYKLFKEPFEPESSFKITSVMVFYYLYAIDGNCLICTRYCANLVPITNAVYRTGRLIRTIFNNKLIGVFNLLIKFEIFDENQ